MFLRTKYNNTLIKTESHPKDSGPEISSFDLSDVGSTLKYSSGAWVGVKKSPQFFWMVPRRGLIPRSRHIWSSKEPVPCDVI